MNVKDLVNELNLKILSGKNGLLKEIKSGYTSDLLSDVMGNADEGSVWVTLQSHKNVVAIASLKEIAAVILVKGIEPEDDAREKSEEEDIVILGTDEEAFEISGKLYKIFERERLV